MKLVNLELFNFRSFHGLQKIEFSTDPQKPLTVITGFNGGGKTNLLNAIYWCFTGQVTPSFKQPKNLVNFDAFYQNEHTKAYVEVLFDADGAKFRARRSYSYETEKDEFTIFRVEKHGESTLINNPENFIQRYIPRGLASWFFYDAEAVGRLQLSGSPEFKRSLRKTLGFELIDTLVEDLKQALRKRERDFAKNAKSDSLDSINKNIDQYENFINRIDEEINFKQETLDSLTSQYDLANETLSHLPQTNELRSKEKRISSNLNDRLIKKQQQVIQRRKFQGESIPCVLINSLAQKFTKALTIKENEGKLPSAYSELLLNEIIKSGKCICGREVSEDSHEHLHIKSLFKSAATTDFNTKIRNLQALVQDIHRVNNSYVEKITSLRDSESTFNDEISGYEKELKDITDQLSGVDEAHIQALIRERADLFNQVADTKASIKSKLVEKNNYETNLVAFKRKLEMEQQRVGVSEKVKHDLDKLNILISHTERSLRNREDRALTILNKELNDLLAKYIRKHFTASINKDNYQVKMFNEHGQETPHSTGEGEVLKYIFLATVVSLASKKTVDKIDFLSEPIIAPLVFDAPFTSLDPLYKKQVASNLVQQASQLILFVLPGNLNDENIYSAIKDYEGKKYILISKEKGDQGQKEIGKVEVQGKIYNLNEYGCDRTESIVKEI